MTPTIDDLDRVPMWRWCVRCEQFTVAPDLHPCHADDLRELLVAPPGGIPTPDQEDVDHG